MSEKGYSLAKVTGRIYKNAIYQKLLPKVGPKKAEQNDNSEGDLPKIDDIDIRIVKLLVKDSRTTLSSIAGALGIGTSTVFKRLSRLRKDGVIRRFTILADGEKLGIGASAYVGINCSKNSKEDVKKILLDIREVVEIYEVLEPYDLLVKVRSSDIKTLKEGPLNILSGLEGVEEAKPILILNTIKEAMYNL
jgi:Lrp/AsnC family transcriptional regulator for asnA, asnC and gidA